MRKDKIIGVAYDYSAKTPAEAKKKETEVLNFVNFIEEHYLNKIPSPHSLKCKEKR